LGAEFKSDDFKFKKSIIVAKGDVDAQISAISVSVKIQLATQALPDGKVVPGF